jgi:NOL1/NOP2/fmu family ribosome biogenesis protein
MKQSLLAALCALALAAPLALAQVQAQDRAQLERRVKSVATLIESSSAARQIDSSGVALAREKRDNARLIHREAAAALKAGDSAAASRLLEQATNEMMSGVRLAKPEQVMGEKERRDFDARMDSARALLAAQQRITAEKGNQAEAREATLRIEQSIAQAEKLAAAGQVAQARLLLDRAYLSARVSIEQMRRGDTLVRSLTFASKREEYAYEIDRNDTHRMMVDLVLGERRDVSPMVKPLLERAVLLRRDAEAQAQRGEHETAIRSLEDSTRELVRVIRAGGIYIPG